MAEIAVTNLKWAEPENGKMVEQWIDAGDEVSAADFGDKAVYDHFKEVGSIAEPPRAPKAVEDENAELAKANAAKDAEIAKLKAQLAAANKPGK